MGFGSMRMMGEGVIGCGGIMGGSGHSIMGGGPGRTASMEFRNEPSPERERSEERSLQPSLTWGNPPGECANDGIEAIEESLKDMALDGVADNSAQTFVSLDPDATQSSLEQRKVRGRCQVQLSKEGTPVAEAEPAERVRMEAA